jgi:hypothetical protein
MGDQLTKIVWVLLIALLPGALTMLLISQGMFPLGYYSMSIKMFYWPGYFLYLATAKTTPLSIHLLAFGSNIVLYFGLSSFLWMKGSYRRVAFWISAILVFLWGGFLLTTAVL